MRNYLILCMVGLAVISLLVNPISAKAAEKTFELKLATHWPVMHDMNNAMVDFGRLIGLESGGRIKVTYYSSGTLAATGEKYLKVRTGVTDITNVHFHLHPKEFPLMQLTTLPFLWTDGNEATWVWNQMNDVWAKEAEAKGIKLLYMIGDPNFQFLLRNKKVIKPEDFKGLRMRCGGFADEAIKVWGAIPVSMKESEIYESMQKGVIDGVVFPVGAGRAFQLEEVTKYIYRTEFFTYGLAMSMNLDTWKRLPKDMQDSVMRASYQAAHLCGYHYQSTDSFSFPYYKAKGVEIYTPTEVELKELKASLAGLKGKMVTDLEKKGLPGKKTLARMEELIQKYRAWSNIANLKMTY